MDANQIADKSGARAQVRAPVLMLRLCTAYPQDSRNGSRSHREPALDPRSVGALVSKAVQFRLHTHAIPPQSPRPGNSRGVHERIRYADVETKKATNRNDEAEGAQAEIHRSFANEGAEPTGPRPCRFSAAAFWHVPPAAAGYAFGIGAGASSLLILDDLAKLRLEFALCRFGQGSKRCFKLLPGHFDTEWRRIIVHYRC